MIGIVKDLNTSWWIKFEKILKQKDIDHLVVDIEQHDWIDQLSNVNYVLWRPNLSEPFFAQAREKLIFIETFLKKKVFPGFDTFWHYDNKNAQAYLARLYEIPFPPTFVSYDYKESVEFLKKCNYPIISKSKGGSASKNVRKYDNYKQAVSDINRVFRRNLKYRVFDKVAGFFGYKPAFYSGQYGYVNLQEFVKGNNRDLRITTIGGKHAYAFFRNNRKDDFRASGSGLIDYDTKGHDKKAIQFFIKLSAQLNFDSMCYDVLYSNDGNFLCVEFSYIYVDRVLFDCPGYYSMEDGQLIYKNERKWPQELIVDILLTKWNI